MKIDYCDEFDNAIIRVSKYELGLILGIRFGDKYGNGGLAFNGSLIGKEFDLDKLGEAKTAIKVAHELKSKIAKDMRYLADRIEADINFSIPEIKRGGDE